MRSFLALFLLTLLLGGCQNNISPDTYSVGSVGQVNRAVRGVVISARPVNVSGSQSGIGGGAGALAGGAAGSMIGGNAAVNVIGAVGGAVAGGVLASVAEEASTRQSGIEYVVQAENGALLTVVQGINSAFSTGQKVIVLYGTKSRIIADTTP